jgi:hypothetical protein
MATINDVWTAYDNATGRWTGCHWRARYGELRLNIKGVSSGKAEMTAERWRRMAGHRAIWEETTAAEEAALVRAARSLRMPGERALLDSGGTCHTGVWGIGARRACARVLAGEWEFASYWLKEIECAARWAETEARDAVCAAEDGDWDSALRHAKCACLIESGYHTRLPWRRLRRAIRQATR